MRGYDVPFYAWRSFLLLRRKERGEEFRCPTLNPISICYLQDGGYGCLWQRFCRHGTGMNESGSTFPL